MTAPTAQELKALTAFFQYAASQYGFYDFKGKAIRQSAFGHGLFTKNLEMLRELMLKGLDLKAFEDHCRFVRKEKRKVEWVTEVVPVIARETGALGKNLLTPGDTYMHRLLTEITPPVSVLPIGAASSVHQSDLKVTHRDEFTLEDLIAHYTLSFGIQRSKEADKAFAGAFNHLLSIYPIDAILLAIDYAIFDQSHIRNPLTLQNAYLPQALEEIQLRKARL